MKTEKEILSNQIHRKTFAIEFLRNGNPAKPIDEDIYKKWMTENKSIYDIESNGYKQIPVVPDNYTYEILGEIKQASSQARNCQFCGQTFPAHYEHESMCFDCHVHWLRERHFIWVFHSKQLQLKIKREEEERRRELRMKSSGQLEINL